MAGCVQSLACIDQRGTIAKSGIGSSNLRTRPQLRGAGAAVDPSLPPRSVSPCPGDARAARAAHTRITERARDDFGGRVARSWRRMRNNLATPHLSLPPHRAEEMPPPNIAIRFKMSDADEGVSGPSGLGRIGATSPAAMANFESVPVGTPDRPRSASGPPGLGGRILSTVSASRRGRCTTPPLRAAAMRWRDTLCKAFV